MLFITEMKLHIGNFYSYNMYIDCSDKYKAAIKQIMNGCIQFQCGLHPRSR